ncbi:MAG: ABC-type transport auxiliary lipoprotein family protein [Syntrophales bacterium]
MRIRWGIILCVVGLAGCIGGTASPPLVRQYVLEYPPPAGGTVSVTTEMLKVERFTAARIYAGPAMLRREGPFRRDAYRERRWRVAPGDMVTDFLRRDLRHAGLFRAVLAPRDPEEARFVLAGGLEEFSEAVDGRQRTAVLEATVTLLDLAAREAPDRVVLQKSYRYDEPFANEGNAEFAASMSRAVSRFSRQVIADIDQALKKRHR